MKFIQVYMVDGSSWNIAFSHWEAIENAYRQFQVNQLVEVMELATPEGTTVILSSARIADFTESTPEGRKRLIEHRKELQAELGYCDNDTAR